MSTRANALFCLRKPFLNEGPKISGAFRLFRAGSSSVCGRRGRPSVTALLREQSRAFGSDNMTFNTGEQSDVGGALGS